MTIGFDGAARQGDRLCHALGRRGDAAGEVGLMRVQIGLQRGDGGIGRGLRLGIAGDGDAAAGEVGIGEAEAEGELGAAMRGLQPGAFLQHQRHRRNHGALHGQRDQEVDLGEGARPRAAAADAFQQQPRRLRAGRLHVDMRVGAVGHQRIRQRHHLPRLVGMRVEADGQRQVRPDHGADPAQQLALRIVEADRDHGAVQFEVDAVERPLLERIRKCCRPAARRCARRPRR